MRMKAAFILRLGVAMRTSEASARAKPPPAAAPSTQAMIGCGQLRMALTRPPVISVKGGTSRVLIRRETIDDLLALDLG